MKIKEIMKSPVICVDPENTVKSVAQILAQKKIHGVPVVEETQVVGMITETDFFVKDTFVYIPSYIDFLTKTALGQSFEEKQSKKIDRILKSKARDIMSFPCITVSPDDSLEKAFKIFKKTQFSALPVVNKKNNAVGIITVSDIIQLIG